LKHEFKLPYKPTTENYISKQMTIVPINHGSKHPRAQIRTFTKGFCHKLTHEITSVLTLARLVSSGLIFNQSETNGK